MRILKILLIVTSITISCQEKKDNLNKSNSGNIIKSDNNMIEEILIKQLEYGYKQIYIDPGLNVQTDKFTEQELETIVLISENILQSNGFRTLSKDIFNQKIKDVFGRIIDITSKNRYLYINLYNRCNREMSFYPNDGIDYNGTYIIKDKGFVTNFYYIPEITDYQREYTNAFNLENNYKSTFKNINNENIKISFWKDLPNLKEIRKKNIQTIIARNMYLFNDNKSQFKWLILNDQYFIESLVKTFGYTQDLDLLKWVIERTKFDKNNPQDYGKLFWIKNCDGTLKLHANTFKILQKIYTPDIKNDMSNDNRFLLNYIKDYIEYLADGNNKEANISNEDRIKILANISYYAEQYKYDKRFVSGYGDNSMIMGRLRFFLAQEDVEILKKNNYFNLPKFKEWWDDADYDEYFVEECEYNGACGKDYQPMNITEWRKLHPKK
ncbi:hypothetical protein [Chryseobacterium aquaticum]|uniref:hypothetical protein n=1 Tax=Chryseobacterium aquaticum TaxID=452084 RepID=UPI002FCC55F2